MAEQNLRVYIIPDLRTWAFPREYEQQSKIEYYSSFEEAKMRFNELRNASYNYEHALDNDGQPSTRLTMGVECGKAAFDILHVRAGENILVDDFTRSNALSLDSDLFSVIRRATAEIGFDKVNSYPLLGNGKYGPPSLVPFKEWAEQHREYHLEGQGAISTPSALQTCEEEDDSEDFEM
ncbi:MAG: hypothetical protein ACI4JS_01650 [Oscillospiraceae bacterium]